MKKIYLLITLIVLGSASAVYSMDLATIRENAKQIQALQEEQRNKMAALQKQLGIASTSRALIPYTPQPAPSAAPAQPEIKRATAAQVDLLEDAQPISSAPLRQGFVGPAAPAAWTTPVRKSKPAATARPVRGILKSKPVTPLPSIPEQPQETVAAQPVSVPMPASLPAHLDISKAASIRLPQEPATYAYDPIRDFAEKFDEYVLTNPAVPLGMLLLLGKASSPASKKIGASLLNLLWLGSGVYNWHQDPVTKHEKADPERQKISLATRYATRALGLWALKALLNIAFSRTPQKLPLPSLTWETF